MSTATERAPSRPRGEAPPRAEAVPAARLRRLLGWPWRYAGATVGDRDLRLDLLRGYCLFAMTIDHVQALVAPTGTERAPSWLHRFSAAYTLGAISAAEVFVFISGLVIGMTYLRTIARHGFRGAMRRLIVRIGKLYGVVVGLAAFYLLLGHLTDLFPDYRSADPLGYLVGALTLRIDVTGLFVLYLLFLALAPLALYAMSEGKTWLVLAASILAWAGNLAYPDYFTTPFPLYFEFAAWQLLFVLGLVLGWHRERIVAALAGRLRPLFIGYLVLLAALTLLLVRILGLYQTGGFAAALPGALGTWAQARYEAGGFDTLYQNIRLSPLRLAGTLIFLQVILLGVTYLYRPLRAAGGWLLIPLGQASMYVYTMHLVVVYLVLPFLPGLSTLPEPFYGLALLGVVLALWAMVRRRFLFFVIPR